MKIKCICNDNRGTDCDYCGGNGWITEKISLGPVPTHRFIIEPEKIWKKITPLSQNKSHTSAKKTFEQRIRELENDLKEIKNDSIEDTIIYLGELLKKLYFDIKGIAPTLGNNIRKIKLYQKTLKRAIKLIRSFDKKFEKYRLTE